MFRATVCFTLFLSVSVAQVPSAKSDRRRFEVAAIHPTDPRDLDAPSGCPNSPALLTCRNVTLKRCIVGAYGVLPDRVLGGPDWIDIDRFQISARPDQPSGDKAMMALLKTLLAERFKLVLHRESRPGETMVLEVAGNGPKLQPAGDSDSHSWKNMHDHLEATKITMGELAEIMSRNLNLQVVDRTGLSGTFNFTLRWNANDANVHDRDEAFAILRLEMSQAIVRQLGLSLKVRRMPVEVLVIDHAEKPAVEEN
jgi:uncharacterized protein (TIGR03435 family)